MYGFTTTLSGKPFEDVRARVIDALKAEGFGVLSEIDVQKAMHEKLGVAMPPYRILGACNPPLAHRALEVDRQIGLLLPCNVVVRADGAHGTVVEALDPQVMVDVTGQADLKPVANEAASRLHAAIDSLTR